PVSKRTTTDNSWGLITGASSGFGEEFARQYAKQGRSLVLVASRPGRLPLLAEALRRQLGNSKVTCMTESVVGTENRPGQRRICRSTRQSTRLTARNASWQNT